MVKFFLILLATFCPFLFFAQESDALLLEGLGEEVLERVFKGDLKAMKLSELGKEFPLEH
jgi:hypothetical protein